MTIRRTIAAALAVTVALGLSACGSSGSGSSGDKQIRVAVSMYTKTIPLYIQMEQGIREEAKKMGASVDFAYANNSAETQSNQINTFVTKGVDIILASPVDAAALVPAYTQARNAGIPVISIGNKVADEDEDAYVGPSLAKVAEATMRAVIKGMGGHGDLLLITGPPQIAFVQQQKIGWTKALAEAPGVNVVDTLVVPDMTTGAAVDVASSGFAAHPEVTGVLSSLDDVSLGAIQAAQSRKMDLSKIYFAGWDGGPAALAAVKSGSYDLTVSMRGVTWGTIALKAAVDWVNGKKISGHYLETPVVMIDQQNIGTMSEADWS